LYGEDVIEQFKEVEEEKEVETTTTNNNEDAVIRTRNRNLAPLLSPCLDNVEEFKIEGKNAKKKNCDWVNAKKDVRCSDDQKLKDGKTPVHTECPVTCDVCATTEEEEEVKMMKVKFTVTKNNGKVKTQYKKKSCDWVVNDKKESRCDMKVKGGKFVWEVCPDSCVEEPEDATGKMKVNFGTVTKDNGKEKIQYKKKTCDWAYDKKKGTMIQSRCDMKIKGGDLVSDVCPVSCFDSRQIVDDEEPSSPDDTPKPTPSPTTPSPTLPPAPEFTCSAGDFVYTDYFKPLPKQSSCMPSSFNDDDNGNSYCCDSTYVTPNYKNSYYGQYIGKNALPFDNTGKPVECNSNKECSDDRYPDSVCVQDAYVPKRGLNQSICIHCSCDYYYVEYLGVTPCKGFYNTCYIPDPLRERRERQRQRQRQRF
jgi:hypothetical protein